MAAGNSAQGSGPMDALHEMKYRRITLGHELGSAAVEERLTAIALLMRKAFPDYRWERHQTGDDSSMHRMHVHLNGRDEPICFTDRELISYSNLQRRTAIDHRMHDVLNRLFRA